MGKRKGNAMVTDELLSRVLRNMRAGIPIENIRENCLASGIDEYSIYLAVKGCQLILNDDQ